MANAMAPTNAPTMIPINAAMLNPEDGALAVPVGLGVPAVEIDGASKVTLVDDAVLLLVEFRLAIGVGLLVGEWSVGLVAVRSFVVPAVVIPSHPGSPAALLTTGPFAHTNWSAENRKTVELTMRSVGLGENS